MPETSIPIASELRTLIENLIYRCDSGMSRSLTDALQSFLTALDYDDIALMKANLHTATVEFADCLNEEVQKRLDWPELARTVCRRAWEIVEGNPLENWDELGTQIESLFKSMLEALVNLQSGPVKLFQKRGFAIENVRQLEGDIEELEQLKKSVLDSWPWANRELPPIDVEMLNASMAAINNGNKGERIEDLIRRLGSEVDRLDK